MRRVIIDLLQCPRCRKGRLAPESGAPELLFGPLHCTACQAMFPVAEGVAELVDGEAAAPGLAQRSAHSSITARAFERYVRPALQRTLTLRPLDRDSELTVYRSLLGAARGPVLDLACGTGLFARRLAQNGGPPVVALDVSRPMIEEAVAQAREAGAQVDFVRAQVPTLPFVDGALGAILHAHGLGWVEDLDGLLSEVRRTLLPGASYVASAYVPPAPLRALQRSAGLHPRAEEALRAAVDSAGLTSFERARFGSLLVFRAQRPSG